MKCQWNPVTHKRAGANPCDCTATPVVQSGDLLLCDVCASLPEWLFEPRTIIGTPKYYCPVCSVLLVDLLTGGRACRVCRKLHQADVVMDRWAP